MGRDRLPPEERKTRINVSIRQKYLTELKEKGVNLSGLIELLLVDWLKKKKNEEKDEN